MTEVIAAGVVRSAQRCENNNKEGLKNRRVIV